jgi:transcriptional regulator with XRE-family HTH domain
MTTRLQVTSAALTANTIKQHLARKGLSQEAFSRLLKLSARQTSRIILGEASPSLDVATRMATVLGVPVETLFTMDVRTRKT